LIAPERFLAQRVSSNLCLRCVRACHALVRSLADLGPRMRPHCLPERHRRNGQSRFDSFIRHALSLQDCPLTSKTKSKSHRSDRVRRKR
jgi:hypothetical protein